MVDLSSVSFFSENNIKNISNDKEKYEKTPFLYLVSSYMKNASLAWANENLKFKEMRNSGMWNIYCFEKTN